MTQVTHRYPRVQVKDITASVAAMGTTITTRMAEIQKDIDTAHIKGMIYIFHATRNLHADYTEDEFDMLANELRTKEDVDIFEFLYTQHLLTDTEWTKVINSNVVSYARNESRSLCEAIMSKISDDDDEDAESESGSESGSDPSPSLGLRPRSAMMPSAMMPSHQLRIRYRSSLVVCDIVSGP